MFALVAKPDFTAAARSLAGVAKGGADWLRLAVVGLVIVVVKRVSVRSADTCAWFDPVSTKDSEPNKVSSMERGWGSFSAKAVERAWCHARS